MSVVFQEGALSDIARVTMGQSPKKEFVSSTQEGLPLLNGPTEFGSSHPTPVQWSTSFSKTAEPGDILFCVRGSTTGRMNWADQQYAIGRGIASISAINPQERHFVRGAIDLVLPELLAAATGSTFPNVSRLQLSELPVALPSAAVRTEISGLLGALDDKIESNRRIAINIEQLIFAQFDSLFNVESSDGGVPISSLVGVNVKRKLDNGNEAVKIPMASLPEGAGSIFTWNREAVSGGARFVNGDVLFARITPCLENGKTAIVDMLNEGEIGFGSTEFIVLSPQGDISTSWIYALARNEAFRNWAQRNMTGSTGRQRFQAAYLDDYLVEPPAGEALSKFNESSEAGVAMLTEKRNETLRLQALRDALLPELMSGRIRVAEACEAIDGEVGDVEIQ